MCDCDGAVFVCVHCSTSTHSDRIAVIVLNDIITDQTILPVSMHP